MYLVLWKFDALSQMYLYRTIELSRLLKKFASSIFSIIMVTTLQERTQTCQAEVQAKIGKSI